MYCPRPRCRQGLSQGALPNHCQMSLLCFTLLDRQVSQVRQEEVRCIIGGADGLTPSLDSMIGNMAGNLGF